MDGFVRCPIDSVLWLSVLRERQKGEAAVTALIVGVHAMLNVIVSISQSLLYITDKRGSARV